MYLVPLASAKKATLKRNLSGELPIKNKRAVEFSKTPAISLFVDINISSFVSRRVFVN
jgi:hypothetical protein